LLKKLTENDRMIIGIDPGQNTGVATFTNGQLVSLTTIQPIHLFAQIRVPGITRVVFEDSRLQSKVWLNNWSHATALKMARNIGEIDAWCKLITAICAELSIDCHGISPRQKGAKLDAKAFQSLTGFVGQSNQHERDAAMVAWPYRAAK
jgi:hypothetical protein